MELIDNFLTKMSNLLPSLNCIKSYLLINAPLVVIGSIFNLSLYLTVQPLSSMSPIIAIIMEVLIFGIKNFTLLFGIDLLTKSRPDINDRVKVDSNEELLSSQSSWKSVISSVATFTILETGTYDIARASGLIHLSAHISHKRISEIIIWAICFFGSFIITSFVVEIIFDFFHYWTHRFLHYQPVLYRSFHSLHHHNSNPTVYHTFNDSVCGTIVTNTIPHIFALLVFSIFFRRPITHSEHSLLLVYKTFVEVSGHSGKELGKASSFPQCKWLPTFFGIELYTFDHHSHHRNSKTNFSKRFVLWDKIFQTYSLQPKSDKKRRQLK